MSIPIEIQYLIYDYAYGTPEQRKYQVVIQLRELSYQFTNRSYINNLLTILCQQNSCEFNRTYWNGLWHEYLYRHFLTPSSARRLRYSNIDVGSISRIFINFDRYGYLGTLTL